MKFEFVVHLYTPLSLYFIPKVRTFFLRMQIFFSNIEFVAI